MKKCNLVYVSKNQLYSLSGNSVVGNLAEDSLVVGNLAEDSLVVGNLVEDNLVEHMY